jgi:copper resistance protein C
MLEVTMNKTSPLALFAALLISGTAFAHARLIQSSPAAESQLTEVPKTLALTFSEAAQLAMLKLSISGKEVPLVIDHSAKASSSITIPLPALQPGSYLVEWSALAADDGHVTRGQFAFSVIAASPKTN